MKLKYDDIMGIVGLALVTVCGSLMAYWLILCPIWRALMRFLAHFYVI